MEVPQPIKSGYRPSLNLLSRFYSIRSTLKYHSDRKIVTAVASPSRPNVFDRLSQPQSARSRISTESAPRAVTSPSRARSPGIPPVEEKLLTKAKESREHLMSLRTRYLSEELSELRPAPTINPLSRKIVERLDRERYGIAPPPVVIQAQLPPKQPTPPHRTSQPRSPQLSIPQKPPPVRSLTQSEMNMLRAMMLHGKMTPSPRTQLGIPPPSDRRTTEAESEDVAVKLATLQSLRNEVMTRFQRQEPELPPDFFSLSFDTRSRVFSENRARKLQSAKQREQRREAQECTFEPIFYARIPHTRLNRSATELLQMSRERSPVPRNETTLRQRIRRSPGYYERYQQRLTETLRQSDTSRDSRPRSSR